MREKVEAKALASDDSYILELLVENLASLDEYVARNLLGAEKLTHLAITSLYNSQLRQAKQ